MSLGDRIKKRRAALKLTQKELALSIGVTPQYISLIEKDKVVPTLSKLGKIADELGITLDHLILGKESNKVDIIASIKADKSLRVEVKKALIAIVNNLRADTE